MNGLSGLLERAAHEPRASLDVEVIRERARQRRRRRRVLLGVTVLLVAGSVGVGSFVAARRVTAPEKAANANRQLRTSGVLHYELRGLRTLTFDYPASWTATEFHYPPGIPAAYDYSAAVYLSNQALHNPCRTQPTQVVAGGTRWGIDCGLPLTTLRPGGVLIEWHEAHGGQSDVLDRNGPTPTTVHIQDHLATLQVMKGGQCQYGRKLPADVTILASIPDRYGYKTTTYYLIACLRGPGVTTAETHVRAMLASARVDD